MRKYKRLIVFFNFGEKYFKIENIKVVLYSIYLSEIPFIHQIHI